MPLDLLTTKLFFPRARRGYVPRPRLIERLSAGLRGPLTLLSASKKRAGPEARPVAPSPLPTQPVVEPLSDRELEVLALLAEDRMRQEIAQALAVSVNTIKAHLKGIYGKLGVHTRREAVARARELGLLS